MKQKLAILNEISLNDYILVFKYYMKNAKCAHVTGFVNAPLLYAKPTDAELEQLVNDAQKHGILIKDGNNTTINEVVLTFINAWAHSPSVVGIKKASFSDKKAIFFARVEGLYLATFQDVSKDKIILAADDDLDALYDYFQSEIEKKDIDRSFKLKNVNKSFKDNGSDVSLEVTPVNRIFLQTLDNGTGRKLPVDELIHVGKKQLEEIKLDEKQKVSGLERKDSSELKNVIESYINRNLPEGPNKKIKADEPVNEKNSDPEFYTRLSFMKLTQSEAFPKGFPGFLKMMLVNFIKSFTNWKELIKKILATVLMTVLTLVWNLFALCYLNDTFNIDDRAIFGDATAYILAGVADTTWIKGFPPFLKTVNTVTITALLYFLLAIAVKSLARDIVTGKAKNNTRHVFSFGTNLKNYTTAVDKSLGFYIWMGLAVAVVLNMIIFNPFTVLLLALMILFSCMKCEDGAFTPFLMMFNSCIRYKSVMSGKGKMPLFGDYQLKLFGVSVGLLLCSVLNWVLWFALDFNFWVRLAISAVFLVFALMKLGIIKVGKPAAASFLIVSLIAIGAFLATKEASLIALADDGGWTESGGTIAGLMQNYGWPTILGFSLVLAGAVAVGCLTFGLGTAVVLGASAITFGTAAGFATFTETGRKTAYDFIWGKYSKYGGDSKIAELLSLGVSLVPGFGDAFGVITGIRDCSYDIKEGDYMSLVLDSFGLALDVHGLSGEVGDLLKHSDDAVDLVSETGIHLDDLGLAGGKNIDDIVLGGNSKVEEMIETAGRHMADMAEMGSKHMDDLAEVSGKHMDDMAEIGGKHADEASSAVLKQDVAPRVDPYKIKEAKYNADNLLAAGNSIKANEEISDAMRKYGKEAGYSEKTINEYLEKIDKHQITDVSSKIWGDGYWDLSDADRELFEEMASNEDAAFSAMTRGKKDALENLMETSKRFDEGVYDSSYTLDQIMDFKLNKNAAPKDYSAIPHGDMLPRADEFISDEAVIDYVKTLCPDNANLAKCTTLEEVANELYENPVSVEFVTFQNAQLGAANFKTFSGNFGEIKYDVPGGGGTFCSPVSNLEAYAKDYSSCCTMENGKFVITDYATFGNEVLSGVKLNNIDGAYMIKTRVPLNGRNLGMPSVNNRRAFLEQFVSGGHLLSGGTEATIHPLENVLGAATDTGDKLVGTVDGIDFEIIKMCD